jgi:predicted metal-binding membrane protein
MTALSRRDRAAVFLLLVLIGSLAWAYTLHQARLMDAMDAAMWRDMNMSMNGMEPSWTPLDAALILIMWSAMMAAMMLPGSAPVVGAFAAINRSRRERGAAYVPTAFFLSGYLAVWMLFSAVAVSLQWACR